VRRAEVARSSGEKCKVQYESGGSNDHVAASDLNKMLYGYH